MTRYILIGFLIVFSLNITAQKINIYASGAPNDAFEDNFVEIGYDDNASIGIDSMLNEKKINEQSTSKNIIAIQRGSENFECAYNIENSEVLFNEDLSLNKDIRSINNDEDVPNSYFQIKLLSNQVSELIIIQPDDLEIKDYLDYIGLVYDCGKEDEIIYFTDIDSLSSNWTISFITFGIDPSEYLNSIILKFNDNLLTTSSTYLSASLSKFKVFPNPATQQLNYENGVRPLKLYNAIGQLVYETTAASGSIDISNFPNGIYYLTDFKRTEKVVIHN